MKDKEVAVESLSAETETCRKPREGWPAAVTISNSRILFN